MTEPEQLRRYRLQIDKAVARYSRQQIKRTDHLHGTSSGVPTEAFMSILGRGGKRVRGALVMAAYDMIGGTDSQLALSVACAIEVIHAYLLVTDDIADRSMTRRGGPTAHVQLSEYHEQHHLRGESTHFGASVAMMSALANLHEVELLIDEMPIPADVKIRLLKSLHACLLNTLHGQIKDIWNEAMLAPTEADALRVVEYKTAYYTLVGPLEMGAVLAGASQKDLGILRRYGLQAGIAFQLVDDVIGVFGDSTASGKSSLDDIREGKATLLVVRALQQANASQRAFLQNALGNSELTIADLEGCKEIIRATGALAYTEELAASYKAKALQELEVVPRRWHGAQAEFLRELAYYLIERRL